MTEADWEDTEREERRDGRLPEGSPTRKRSVAGQRPHYLDLEEARQLLAEMNIHLTPRQIALVRHEREWKAQATLVHRSHRGTAQNREERSAECLFQSASRSGAQL